MIRITFNDKSYDNWSSDLFTEYHIKSNKFFIIMKNDKCVGIYNMDNIMKITILNDQSLIKR